MGTNAGQPAVNKGLMMVFIVILLLGAAYLAYRAMQPGEEDVPGVAKVPDNITPVTAEEMARGPQPTGYK